MKPYLLRGEISAAETLSIITEGKREKKEKVQEKCERKKTKIYREQLPKSLFQRR